MNDADKAAILDWLLTPQPSGRPDRPDVIARDIDRIPGRQALVIFRAWGTPASILEALHQAASTPIPPVDPNG